MPVLPGAEPFQHDGGPVGALLCHGFTGSPQSLRPWAEHLAAAGLSVSLPRLPGHGTTWRELAHTRWEDWYAELDRAFEDLRARCDEIFVMGLSVGGCLALRLAELHPTQVSGLVLVNPLLVAESRLFLIAPVLRVALRSVKGVADDIRRKGVHELAYDRIPVPAAASLPRLWKLTRSGLAGLTQPVLVYRSPEDHVVGPASVELLRAAIPPERLTVEACPDSYHVATLDNDAERIFAGSLSFVRAHSGTAREPDR